MKLTITEEANQQVLLAISSDTSVIFTRIELEGLTTYSTTEILPPADGGVGVSTVINKSDVPGKPTFNTLNIYAKVGFGAEFLFATTGMNVDFSGSEDKKIILTVYLEVSDSENVTFEYSGGDNAYSIALEQGFEGSAQDWLDSLKVSVDSYTQDIRGDTVIHFTDGTDVTIETGETDRVSSENERVTAESERVSNEQARQAHYNELIDTGLMEENIAQKLSELVDYTPSFKLVELTGSSPVIDLTEGTIFHQEITGKVEYTFVTDKNSEGFKIILDTENGTHPVILPNSVIWHEDRIPDLSKLYTTYILEFLTIDGGTNWYGKVVFQFSAFETLIPGYVWVRDDNFSGDKDGDFRYIGTDDKVSMRRVIKGIPVTSYYAMFTGTGVSGVHSLNDNVTNMNAMFYNSSATTLDLNSFDTSNVTNMTNMFYNSLATTLDLSSFNTSNVTNMSYMFRGSKATTLDLSSFDTSKVTDMNAMFYDSLATTLDLSSFDTSNVTNMSYMFRGSKATTLDVSSFDTSNVTDMSSMFSRLSATTLDVSSFDTSNVTNMSYMFYNSLTTTLDLSSFDTSNVTDMSSMFRGSKATTGYARTQADADKFNASSDKPSTLNFVVK